MPKQGNEIDFKDGQGPKSKATPDEFASDWHLEAHVDALERNLAGLLHRVAELEGMPAAHPDQIAAAEADAKAAKVELAKYAKGQKSAAKRPRRAKETR